MVVVLTVVFSRERGHDAIVKMLLAVGAECREEGDGQSPLDMAASENIHYSIEGDMRLVLRVAWCSVFLVFLCVCSCRMCLLSSVVHRGERVRLRCACVVCM